MKPDLSTWAREASELIKLENVYPFYVFNDLDLDGKQVNGFCEFTPTGSDIRLTGGWKHKRPFLSVYLHEVAHAVAMSAGVHDAPSGKSHNKYFATILGVMYRRAGLFDRLSLYDFADGLNYVNGESSPGSAEGMVDGRELALRFTYIVRTSATLASSNLSIEATGRWLFENDFFGEQNIVPKKKTSSRWVFWR